VSRPPRVVWTAVVAAVAGLGAVVAGAIEGSWTTALGLLAVTAALLSSRER